MDDDFEDAPALRTGKTETGFIPRPDSSGSSTPSNFISTEETMSILFANTFKDPQKADQAIGKDFVSASSSNLTSFASIHTDYPEAKSTHESQTIIEIDDGSEYSSDSKPTEPQSMDFDDKFIPHLTRPHSVNMQVEHYPGFQADFDMYWNHQDRLKMPCAYSNQFHDPTNPQGPLSKWTYIASKLTSVSEWTVDELESTIRSYNPTHAPSWPAFDNLRAYCYFNQSFLSETLPYIIQIALDMPKLFPFSPPLLKQQCSMEVIFSQKQCVSLIANMFLCTFEARPSFKSYVPTDHNHVTSPESAPYPTIGFDVLFGQQRNTKINKLACIVEYFNFHSKNPNLNGPVSFRRQVLRDSYSINWSTCRTPIGQFQIDQSKPIEAIYGAWQADFANKLIGGGVLGNGCVQEEIRMAISPELLVARLITQELAPNEALVITGSQQYSSYRGYSDSFEFTGPFLDPHREPGTPPCVVTAFDAIHFPRDDVNSQFKPDLIWRELDKAYIAFIGLETDTCPIASGHWGCGAFNGDRQLKFIIQLLAASATARELVYCVMGDFKLAAQAESLRSKFAGKKVCDVFKLLMGYRPGREDVLGYLNKKLDLEYDHQNREPNSY